ncbi:methyltransferase domain-containing protein [Hyphomicrobiales bacterium]|nr:methyltransferase domain-containing protein [Hyphomicrobiales bacterium]
MSKENIQKISKEDKSLLLEIFDLLKKSQSEKSLEKIQYLLKKYPEDPDISRTAASIFAGQGKLDQSINILENVIKKDKGDYNTYFLQADNYAKIGNIELAEKNILLCIKANPKWRDAYRLFFRILLNNLNYKYINHNEIADVILETLKHGYVQESDIKGFIEKFLIQETSIEERLIDLEMVINKNPSKSFEEIYVNNITILNNKILLLLLSKVTISNYYLEKYLTLVRKTILLSFNKNIIQEDQKKELEDFLFSLNHQNFLNGSIWIQNEKERNEFSSYLIEVKKRIQKKESLDEFYFLLLGCYLPLEKDQEIKNYIERNFKRKNVNIFILIERYKNLEKKEKKIIKKIIQDHEILNKNSLKIMKFYNDHPSKNWTTLNLNNTVSFVQYLRNDLSPILLLGEKKAIKSPEILFIGCGSGREAILLSSIQGSQVDAIDLSIRNLSYAAIKAEEHNVRNINFIKLDFLDIKKLEKKYDVIVIDEVLGEIEDANLGMELIASVLKPGGFVKVYLKSAVADKKNKNIKKLVDSKNFQLTYLDAIGIRNKIFEAKGDDFNQFINNKFINDINSLYHLLVPTYNSKFDIKFISDLIKNNNFIFQGWSDFIENPDLRYKIIKLYSNNYPDDDFLKNLDNWYNFEEQNPLIFSNMYSFWMTIK